MRRALAFRCVTIALAVSAVFVALRAVRTPFLEQLNLRLLDIKFRLRGTSPSGGGVVLVVVDSESLAKVGRWPWPRAVLARLVREISRCNPRAVGLDIIFAGDPPGGRPRDPAEDRELADSLGRPGGVVLSTHFYLSREEGGFQPQRDFESVLETIRSGRIESVLQTGIPTDQSFVLQAYGAEASGPEFQAAAGRSGFYNALAHADGSIRQIPLVIRAQGDYYQSFAVAVLMAAVGEGVTQLVMDGPAVRELKVGPVRIPCDEQGLYLVNYYTARRGFPEIPAWRILAGEFDPKELEGRIALVGGTAPGSFELRVSPLNPVAASIDIQATIVDNALTGRFIGQRIFGPALTAAVLVAFTLLAGLAVPFARKPWQEACAAALLLAAYLACDYLFFVRLHRNLSTFYPLASILAASLAAGRYVSRARERWHELQRKTALDLSEVLNRMGDPRGLPDKIVAAFVEITGASRGLLAAPSADGHAVEAARGIDRGVWEGEGFGEARRAIAQSLRDGRIAIETSPRGGVRWSVCVPLAGKGSPRGAVYLDGVSAPPPFGFDAGVLATFANQAAIALENAALYARLREEEEKLRRENLYLRKEIETAPRPAYMIGNSVAIRRVYALIHKAAESSIAVLIQGETGTGKELIARAIHFTGARKDAIFVAQNCGALPAALLESELFGHVKGAFTGAVRDKKGLFEAADGGTIFLDEVGDMPAELQVKLLRVLQEGVIRPVGGVEERRVDLRVVSATNKDLAAEVREGRFREDLYYRLNAFIIHAPPLRERTDDIPALVTPFLAQASARLGKKVAGISREALERLAAYPFPGNVRELENEIEKDVLLIPEGGMIDTNALSEKISAARPTGPGPAFSPEQLSLGDAVSAVQREWIAHALTKHGGNKTKAAEELGVDRKTLHSMIERLGL